MTLDGEVSQCVYRSWIRHWQSGLPFADDDDRPFPRRPPAGGWLHGNEDGRPMLGQSSDQRARPDACGLYELSWHALYEAQAWPRG